VAGRAAEHLRSHQRAAHVDVIDIADPAAAEAHLREERELRRLEKMIAAIEAASPRHAPTTVMLDPHGRVQHRWLNCGELLDMR
jgi:hypothetical protein